MHSSHLPLRTWFLAAHIITSHSNGMSALQLQAQLGLGSYKTAWLLLQKLRRSMVNPERNPLKDLVEIDETEMPFRSRHDPQDRPKGGRSPDKFADDTPVKLQVRANTTKTKTARLCSYVRGERPWCGTAPPCAWYQFSIDRKGEHPANHLAGYTGTVHADGYAGFNGLFGEGKADEQACMVHVRRKFVDEVERTGSPIAQQAIKQIAQLYAVEKGARGKSPGERATLRQAKAKPVFDALELWLQAQLHKISGKTKLAEAIRYALNRMPKDQGHHR
jgi:hypothetical protein